MKFTKSAVCGAMVFAVATLMATQSQPAYSATVWNLFDHPAGAASPPPYGLRIDGIEHFYQSYLSPTTITAGDSDTWLFSFDHFANTTLTLNDAEDRITIQGTLFGGRDADTDSSELGSVDLVFTYDLFQSGAFNGLDSFVFQNGSGTLTFNEQIQSIAAGAVFNLEKFGPEGLYQADQHRLENFGCPDAGNELCQRQVGRDWIGLTIPDADGGGVFHANYQDFLYTGQLEVIPLPAALPLFLTGLAGLGFMRRRKRRA